jgi:hypothetical protein
MTPMPADTAPAADFEIDFAMFDLPGVPHVETAETDKATRAAEREQTAAVVRVEWYRDKGLVPAG